MTEAEDDTKSESRAAEGAEHLQTAAIEMISAVRAFLDVAEDVVTNNDRVDDLTRILGSVAQGVSNATGFTVPGTRPAGQPSEPASAADGEASSSPTSATSSSSSATSGGPDVDLRPSGVQHIRVS